MSDGFGYFGARGIEEAARLEKSQASAMSTTCAGELAPGLRCGRAGLYQWTSRVFCQDCPTTGGRYCAEHAELHATHVRVHLAELKAQARVATKRAQRSGLTVGSRARYHADARRTERKAKRKTAAAARRANKRRAA